MRMFPSPVLLNDFLHCQVFSFVHPCSTHNTFTPCTYVHGRRKEASLLCPDRRLLCPLFTDISFRTCLHIPKVVTTQALITLPKFDANVCYLSITT
jgi:hypothetical protein